MEVPHAQYPHREKQYIGLVLAGVVAVLILAGSVFLKADQSGDVTSTQPTTESPTTGDTKTP
jgi:hypothetical protein